MKIKSNTNSKKNLAKVSIEFDSDFEKNKFIDYVNQLVFDGILFSKQLDKNKISGVYTDLILDKYIISNVSHIAASQGEPFAIWYNTKDINTDTERFQNRTNAFSELSTEQVEKNFDQNKFDPIVVWNDPKNEKIFVLSGHSRLEGMKRRKEKYIPVRFFVGSENEAIAFARIDANRVANKEDLVSDLKAYILARDGNIEKNISPYSSQDLKQAFKGKESKLESLSYLNPKGLFIEKLSDEDTISQYPRIQSYAAWVGALRKELGNKFTNTHEKDTFLYFYLNPNTYKITREEFSELVKERLALGKDRLFPECDDSGCVEIKDFKEVGQNRELYLELNKIRKELETFKKRFETSSPALKIYTQPEKKILTQKALAKEKELKNLQRDLKNIEDAPTLFGPSDIDFEEVNYLIYYTLDKDKKFKKYFTFKTTRKEAIAEFKEVFAGKKVSIKKVVKL